MHHRLELRSWSALELGSGRYYSKAQFHQAAPDPKRLCDHNQSFLPHKRCSLDSHFVELIPGYFCQYLQGCELSPLVVPLSTLLTNMKPPA